MRIQQKVALFKKNCKWKTGLTGKASRSKLAYLSADPNMGPFTDQFPLCNFHFGSKEAFK